MHTRSMLLLAALSIGTAPACAGRQAVVGSPMASSSPQMATGGWIHAGTRLVATLDTPIGTDVSRVGDPFFATMMTPIVDEQGSVVIPAGAKIVGRVADLRTTRGGEPAVVGLEVQSISFAGASRPLGARVVEADVQATSRHPSGRAALGGAAGGALIGAILGGGSGAAKGGLVGAGAGTLISLGVSETGARLPSGTRLAIEITQPVPTSSMQAM